jgi:hypothetical protein
MDRLAVMAMIASLPTTFGAKWSTVESAIQTLGQTHTLGIVEDGQESLITQVAGIPVLGMELKDALSMFHRPENGEVQIEVTRLSAANETCTANNETSTPEEHGERTKAAALLRYYSRQTITGTMDGYVISTSNQSARYNSAIAVIARAGIQPVWVKPNPASEFADKNVPKAWSLKFTHHRIWERIGKDKALQDDDWVLVFEDDIALHPSLDSLSGEQLAVVIRQSLKGLAAGGTIHHRNPKKNRGTGFAFLGVCGPIWEGTNGNLKSIRRAVNLKHGGVKISIRGSYGLCLHAYALQKQRARSLLRDMRRFLPSAMVEQPYIDVTVRDFLKFQQTPALTVGANFVSPQAKDHIGLFFQDRESYPSTADAPSDVAKADLNTWEHVDVNNNWF